MDIPYYCPLVLSTKGITSVTIKLKVVCLTAINMLHNYYN